MNSPSLYRRLDFGGEPENKRQRVDEAHEPPVSAPRCAFVKAIYRAVELRETLDPVFTGSFALRILAKAAGIKYHHVPGDLDIVVNNVVQVDRVESLGYELVGSRPSAGSGTTMRHRDGVLVDFIIAKLRSPPVSIVVEYKGCAFRVMAPKSLLSYYRDVETFGLSEEKVNLLSEKIALLEDIIGRATILCSK